MPSKENKWRDKKSTFTFQSGFNWSLDIVYLSDIYSFSVAEYCSGFSLACKLVSPFLDIHYALVKITVFLQSTS